MMDPAEQLKQLQKENSRLQKELARVQQISQKAQSAEERYNRLIDALGDNYCIYNHDQNGIFTYLSPSVEKMLGYTLEEFMTHYSTYLTDSPINKNVEKFTELALRGERQPPYQIEILHKNGAVKILEVTEYPVFNEKDEVVAVEGITQDITRRIETEKILKNQERFHKQLLDDMLTFVAVLTPDGDVIFVNNTPLKVGGFELADIIGKKFYDAAWWTYSEKVRETLIQDIKECAGGKSLAHEIQINTADGSLMWIEYSMHPIFDDNGKVQYLIPEGRNIEETKKAEEQHKRLEKQLRQSQKMEAIGTLAGGIAHDFNNILGVILNYAELLKDEIPLTANTEESIDSILIAANRAKELVAQILAFSRQSDATPHNINLAILLKEALKMIRSSLPTTISIEENISTDCGNILANPTQIHQVIINLCNNAFQAMAKTGGTLKVSLQNMVISRDNSSTLALKPGEYVLMTIRDTGCGIPENIIDKIFDPFFTTKEVGGGTGMGLSISHGIITSYCGAITVTSTIERGSEFRVYLPVSPIADIVEQQEVETRQGQSERVLLVDDEQMLLKVGQKILEKLGYSVLSFQSSREALKSFQANPWIFDVVITDQTMPEMTGMELTEKIHEAREDIPVILYTGYSHLIDRDEALALGVTEFAYKPLTGKGLSKILNNILKKD